MTLALALILDALLGEPRALWDRWPHPAVLMGRAVAWLDARLNTGGNRRLRGVAAVAVLVGGAVALGGLLAALPGGVAEVAVGAVLIAQRSLCDHVARVAAALRLSTGDGRQAVAMIVGRDTGAMDDAAIARAAIESGAENLSDGVVAPLFWFALAGLPGLIAYKVVNTADSMIGHCTPRHEAFGWAAARLDDLLNLIPARLTAVLIWLAAPRVRPDLPRGEGFRLAEPGARTPPDAPGGKRVGSFTRVWPAIRRDARLHRSPNAGWPEAAMARALDVALSGPRSYHGRMQDFPWVHPAGRRDPGAAEIDAAVTVLWRVWGLLLAGIVILALIR